MADAVGAPPAANEEILEQLPAIPPPSMTPSVPVMTDVPSVGSGPSGAAAAAPADPPAYSGVAVAGVDAQRAPRLATPSAPPVQPPASGGAGTTTVYAFPVGGAGAGRPPASQLAVSNMPLGGAPRASTETAITATAEATVTVARDTSPRSMRKASHNAVEVRRRRRISLQLDRLKAMLQCPKVDKASLLNEAVNRLSALTQRCHGLESELAHLRGTPPPAPLPPVPQIGDMEITVVTVEAIPAGAGGGVEAMDTTGDAEVKPSARAPLDVLALPSTAVMGERTPAGPSGEQMSLAQEAEQGEAHLQMWAQLGESALRELLAKHADTTWNHVLTRDDVTGYIAEQSEQQKADAANPETPARLDYCLKAETTLPLDPESVANAYMQVSERQKWHSSCSESRLVEELWPRTLLIAFMAFHTELPIYPRGYCALFHRSTRVLPDGRSQIVIADRSVTHSEVPASRQMIFLDVQPSGLVITPVQVGDAVHSHLSLVAHYDLKGIISSHLLQRIQATNMLEIATFKYVAEFKAHVTASLLSPAADLAAMGAGQEAASQQATATDGSATAQDSTDGAATLIYAAESVNS